MAHLHNLYDRAVTVSGCAATRSSTISMLPLITARWMGNQKGLQSLAFLEVLRQKGQLLERLVNSEACYMTMLRAATRPRRN